MELRTTAGESAGSDEFSGHAGGVVVSLSFVALSTEPRHRAHLGDRRFPAEFEEDGRGRVLAIARGAMAVLASLRVTGRPIDFGVATTGAERDAILAQRFRVYQRRGYHRPGLTVERDRYDEGAVYVFAMVRNPDGRDLLVGSARLVRGAEHPSFVYPTRVAMEFEMPEALRGISVRQRIDVGRVVSERTEGTVLGALVTPLGLLQAIAEHSRRHQLRGGLAVLKRRFLDALLAAGIALHEIDPATVVYPRDGVFAPYFYRHRDPVAPVYWLLEEIAPTVVRAIARYVDGESRALSPPREVARA